MEFIYTDKNGIELGYLSDASIDIDIGTYSASENDFELTIPTASRDPEFDKGSLFYLENTEWGGMVDNLKVDTANNKITFKGKTFRGLLTNEYVQPPEGQSHLILKGNAKACIESMLGNRFESLYIVDNTNININYKVRDLNLLEAIEKALANANAKLNIKYHDGEVHLCVGLIRDLSELIQYDNSYNVDMIVETKPEPYNHILALGKGELIDRLRLNLYLQNDGTWSENKVIRGLKNKTYKYENPNTDTLEKLKSEAIKKVEDQNSSDQLNISFDADDAELFDIVGAKEQVTGISFKQPITQKILKLNNGNVDITYKVGE